MGCNNNIEQLAEVYYKAFDKYLLNEHSISFECWMSLPKCFKEGIRVGIAKILATIEKEENDSWIPMSKELPPYGTEVEAKDDNITMKRCHATSGNPKGFYWDESYTNHISPTHWRPIK